MERYGLTRIKIVKVGALFPFNLPLAMQQQSK